jgi:hypothetical protein
MGSLKLLPGDKPIAVNKHLYYYYKQDSGRFMSGLTVREVLT